jgi:hypothetical protein
MKEVKVAEWIYKGRKERKTTPVTFRVPEDVKMPKGVYLVKVYRLESDV